MQFQHDALYYGDCLDVMREWPAACVDLCYLDPPFKSDTDYNILFGKDRGPDRGTFAQMVAFEDTWAWDAAAQDRVDAIERAVAHPAHTAIHGLRLMLGECGMLAYVSYMAERLAEIRRVLKPGGSVYLHCDPMASHYLKVLMDRIFGGSHFRNEIVWKRTTAHSDSKTMGAVHDVILHYSRTAKLHYNIQYADYDESYIEQRYKRRDPDGRRWMDGDLSAKGLKGSGYEYEYKGATSLWRVPLKKMKQLDAENRLHFTSRGGIRIKRYLDEMKGVPINDVWTDIPPVNSQSKERLGYRTQKPVDLLTRIVEASSKPGDVVLDPFCGCGTTVVAARNEGRRFVGIDVAYFAIDLVRKRRLKDDRVPVNGIPADMFTANALAKSRPFEFETWAVTRVPGLVPNQRQVGDGGIDGRGKLLYGDGLVLAQVKGGHFKLGELRDFCHVLNRENAACGVFATLNQVATPKAQAEAQGAGYIEMGANRYPKAQLWSIEDYFQGRFPNLPPMADPYTGKQIQTDIFAP